MKAYRCRECTLVRCDKDGAVCMECMANLPNFGIAPSEDSRDALYKTFTIVGNSGLTFTSPPTPTPTAGPPAKLYGTLTTLVLISGDHKNNARVAAQALMAISWTELMAFASGQPGGASPALTGAVLSRMHSILRAFGVSP